MALVGVELKTFNSKPNAMTTRPPGLTLIKKDRQSGEHRKCRVFIKGAEL